MTPTAEQPQPEHIGRYRLLGRLGAGGMGTVYRAHDPHLDRIVALKVPRLDGPPEQRAARVQRFQREARAAARILHPNVCPIFDVGEHDGAAFVVMAYVEGQSLDRVLAQRGAFADVREAVGLIAQVLDGLAAVHAQGVVHRDVKPGNILLDAAGRCTLTDFGLARPEESGAGLTSEGVVVGTPAYMAPEQAAGQPDQIGPWTDLYAVGVVLFQLLTGRLPFEGQVAAVLGAVLRDEPPSPRAFRPDLPSDLEAAIVRALRKDPRMRFVDARDFSAALANLKGPAVSMDRTLAQVLPAAREAPPQRITRRAWIRRRLLWLPGAVFVAGGGAVAAALLFLVFSSSESLGPSLAAAAAGTVFLAVPLMLAGLGLWFGVELSHVPEGLWFAAAKGLTGRVQAAAANGVPLDLPDDLGETALMHAAAGGHAEVVKVLLLYGVDTRAVSPLGQTALEIAYAASAVCPPIVALLQRETRPQRRAEAVPAPPPSARRWLIGAALLGALLIVGYNWVCDPWPTRLSFDEVRQMVQAKQVKTIEFVGTLVPGPPKFLRGEVTSPVVVTSDRHRPRLFQGRFCVEMDGSTQPNLQALDPGLRMIPIASMPAREPSAWAIALLLGVPAAVAALLGWPLGTSWWFPALRPARRRGRATAAP